MTDAHAYAQAHAGRFRDQLKELLAIPSVSTQPEHAADVRRAAAWLVADMQRIGLTRAEAFEQPGSLPIIYGEWLGAGAGAPTVLVYSHYDVQPAALADGWHSDPFTPLEREGKLYARGALDSKIHVVAWLKAAEALLAAGDAPVNLKLLFEGEEESGSEHIFGFLADNPDLVRADVCVVSDGSMPNPQQPVLVYGLRGIISFELTVSGPLHDLHSGHYGGTVHNPIQALAELLAGLHDAQGRVTVPGFYDDVLPLSAGERQTLAGMGAWSETEWRTVAGAPSPWGEPDYALHERIGARPTLEFNGIAGGFYGEGFKTVLPARALAKISCRLVPNQQPARIAAALEADIARRTPPTVRSVLRTLEAGAPGVLLERDSAPMRAAVRAYERGWGRAPVFTREGGSIPVVDVFQRIPGAPIVLLPFGYKGGRAHGPDENIHVDMFHKGIDTALYFIEALTAS
jgi:acetylornithine deacetylase/succinyl-diaminopimelate desuccinylase-like protein